MKKGSCIINDIDIADLGMFILQGGDYDLFSFPQRVEPVQNDWYEQDGIDVDLEEIHFKEKKVTISFYLSAENSDLFRLRLERFFSLFYTNLRQKNKKSDNNENIYKKDGYIKFKYGESDHTFYLRYISCPEYSHREGLYKSGRKSAEIRVEFSMDEPLQFFTDPTILIPDISYHNKTYISLNGYDLSRFGIIVSECYNSVMKLADAKAPLTRTFEYKRGLESYPSVSPRLQNKQIIISCTMLADSLDRFLYNYQALFNNINKKNALAIVTYYDDFECYYSDMQNFIKEEPFDRRIKVSFDLIFNIIHPNRPVPILVTENLIPLTTENNANYIRTSSTLK